MSKYIKKADYIAMYGEEAWIAHTAKKNEYGRQWREEHPDYDKQYGKRYYEEHKEEKKEYGKQWHEEHPDYKKQYGKRYYQDNIEECREYSKRRYQDNIEECREYGRQYYQDNIEERKEYSRQYRQEHREEIKEKRKERDIQYRQEHREEIKEYNKQHRCTQMGRATNLKGNYINMDKIKGFPTDKNVDEDWIIENIFGSSCIYCGESDWTKLGCDRIDNTKGHTPDNVVCSCWDCNNERKNKFTVEEFIQYRKLHPREQQVPDADDKVIDAWKGRFKISSKSIRV